MSEKESELFITFNFSIGDHCTKSERAAFGVREPAIVYRGKVRVLRSKTFRVKGMKDVFIDTRKVCGKGGVMHRNWVCESASIIFKEIVI